MIEWQPIETAPTDETVLIYWDQGVQAGYLNPEDGWYAVAGHGSKWLYQPPTHWMPLPNPPLTPVS
jgi:hypothetical protein